MNIFISNIYVKYIEWLLNRWSLRLEPLLLTWIYFNSSISNHMPCKVWDEITCPFLKFNGGTAEVYE